MRLAKMRLATDQLRALGVEFSQEDLARHIELCKPHRLSPDPAFLAWAREWLVRLARANRTSRLYPHSAFRIALGEYWWKLCSEVDRPVLARWRIVCSSPLAPSSVSYQVRRLLTRMRGERRVAEAA